MKTRLLWVVLFFSAICMTSCDVLKSTASSANNSAAYTSGTNAGKALRSLYTQYKADGKFEMTNLTNISNLLLLTSSWDGIKSAKKDSDYYKDFSKGIIAGSNDLVTNNNSGSVIDAITTTVNAIDNSGLTNQSSSGNSGNTNTTEVVNTVTSLMTLFGK